MVSTVPAPDPQGDTYRRALHRAVTLLGSAVAVSERLQIPVADIMRWLSGEDRPSFGNFLRIVDVLNEEDSKAVRAPTPKAG